MLTDYFSEIETYLRHRESYCYAVKQAYLRLLPKWYIRLPVPEKLTEEPITALESKVIILSQAKRSKMEEKRKWILKKK